MKSGKSGKPVSPIYTIGLIFVLFSIFRPISSIFRLIAVGVIAAIGFGVVRAIFGGKQEKDAQAPAQQAATRQTTAQRAASQSQAQQKQTAQKKEPPKPKYSPEVQAVVDEGARAHSELQRLYAVIPDLTVKHKILEIIDVSDKIVEDAIHDPSDVPQIKKFLDYYLPTTIKLLNAYDRMGSQGIEGENISKTMGSINEMLDTAIVAYRKLLDSLFANQAMDIETDIAVMNTLMKREGLAEQGNSFRASSQGGAATATMSQ
ncbi:MAG: 5-bromo-4-chloroindolyl phosphate hydrolysis family protein [Oscillospiraceae bacterium]|nr:5-bromo-4-chloroindolyl phosphate hydrolysis family protein [Oscillospiraceae bacterium]